MESIAFMSGKKRIRHANNAHKKPASVMKNPTNKTILRAVILEYGCCPSSILAIFKIIYYANSLVNIDIVNTSKFPKHIYANEFCKSLLKNSLIYS